MLTLMNIHSSDTGEINTFAKKDKVDDMDFYDPYSWFLNF